MTTESLPVRRRGPSVSCPKLHANGGSEGPCYLVIFPQRLGGGRCGQSCGPIRASPLGDPARDPGRGCGSAGRALGASPGRVLDSGGGGRSIRDSSPGYRRFHIKDDKVYVLLKLIKLVPCAQRHRPSAPGCSELPPGPAATAGPAPQSAEHPRGPHWGGALRGLAPLPGSRRKRLRS